MDVEEPYSSPLIKNKKKYLINKIYSNGSCVIIQKKKINAYLFIYQIYQDFAYLSLQPL